MGIKRMEGFLGKLGLGHIIDPDDGRVCFKRLTGIPNIFTFHIWNWVIILDSIGKSMLQTSHWNTKYIHFPHMELGHHSRLYWKVYSSNVSLEYQIYSLSTYGTGSSFSTLLESIFF